MFCSLSGGLRRRWYEPVEWFVPSEKSKRPLVFLGVAHVGRHEFREELINCAELRCEIDVAVPHTTRAKRDDEIDGRDYHFFTREQFEVEIEREAFVEYGEYQGNLYGTSKSSVETCSHRWKKITILNLLPEGVQALKYSNLFPYVIFFDIPPSKEEFDRYSLVTEQHWKDLHDESSSLRLHYSHLFDQTILLNQSFDSILSLLKSLVQLVQHQPMWINRSWFAHQQRF